MIRCEILFLTLAANIMIGVYAGIYFNLRCLMENAKKSKGCNGHIPHCWPA